MKKRNRAKTVRQRYADCVFLAHGKFPARPHKQAGVGIDKEMLYHFGKFPDSMMWNRMLILKRKLLHLYK